MIYRKNTTALWFIEKERWSQSDVTAWNWTTMDCWEQNSSTTHREDIEECPIPAYFFFAFGVLGNVLALCTICLNRQQHQWRSFYIFFLGLAISDGLNQLSVFPFEVLSYESHFRYRIPDVECHFISFSYAFTQISSGLIIAGITTDQHISLIMGRQLDTMVGNRRIYIFALFAMLAVAAFVSSIHLIFGESEIFYPGSWCFIDVSSEDFGSSASALVYALTGIITLIYTASLHLYIVCRSHRDIELRGHLVDTDRITGFYDIHVNIFLMTSVTFYVLFWGPFLVDVLLRSVNVINNCTGRLELWLVRLVDIKSNLNPWLYVLLRKENLRRIVRTFRSCRARNIQTRERNGESDRLVRDTHMWENVEKIHLTAPPPKKKKKNVTCHMQAPLLIHVHLYQMPSCNFFSILSSMQWLFPL